VDSLHARESLLCVNLKDGRGDVPGPGTPGSRRVSQDYETADASLASCKPFFGIDPFILYCGIRILYIADGHGDVAGSSSRVISGEQRVPRNRIQRRPSHPRKTAAYPVVAHPSTLPGCDFTGMRWMVCGGTWGWMCSYGTHHPSHPRTP
jgi:hypothetical protein